MTIAWLSMMGRVQTTIVSYNNPRQTPLISKTLSTTIAWISMIGKAQTITKLHDKTNNNLYEEQAPLHGKMQSMTITWQTPLNRRVETTKNCQTPLIGKEITILRWCITTIGKVQTNIVLSRDPEIQRSKDSEIQTNTKIKIATVTSKYSSFFKDIQEHWYNEITNELRKKTPRIDDKSNIKVWAIEIVEYNNTNKHLEDPIDKSSNLLELTYDDKSNYILLNEYRNQRGYIPVKLYTEYMSCAGESFVVYYCVVKFRCNYSFNTSPIIPHLRGRLYPRHQNKGKQVNFRRELHQIRGRLSSPQIFSPNFRGRLQMVRGRCLQHQLLHQIQLQNILPEKDNLPKDMTLMGKDLKLTSTPKILYWSSSAMQVILCHQPTSTC